jgi:hypothetical protein
MEITQPNVSLRSEQSSNSADLPFQRELEHGLNELRADMVERPLLYAGMAFVAGFVSNTFPARVLFHVLVRLISWLLGPAILLLGVIKFSGLFSNFRRDEPTILRRP